MADNLEARLKAICGTYYSDYENANIVIDSKVTVTIVGDEVHITRKRGLYREPIESFVNGKLELWELFKEEVENFIPERKAADKFLRWLSI